MAPLPPPPPLSLVLSHLRGWLVIDFSEGILTRGDGIARYELLSAFAVAN